MKILLLLPVILYVILVLTNPGLLEIPYSIGFFGFFKQTTIPIISYLSAFFIGYVIIIWVYLTSLDIIVSYKRNSLNKEILKLRGKLLNGQEDLVNKIGEKFENILTAFIEESNKKIEAYKKENEKVISNLEYKLQIFEQKIEKIKKQ